jgi:hypothetical protein
MVDGLVDNSAANTTTPTSAREAFKIGLAQKVVSRGE